MSGCHPTKEQLENDYFNLILNHQQIAEKYKFKTRQVIHRLFKKYDIKSRTKIADFIMDNKNIEFDGDYWHGFENVKIKDKKRDNYLSKLGYKILRIKEADYKKDPQKVIRKCIKFLLK